MSYINQEILTDSTGNNIAKVTPSGEVITRPIELTETLQNISNFLTQFQEVLLAYDWAQTRVGPTNAGDATFIPFRSTRDGSLVTSIGLTERVLRGNVYSSSNQSAVTLGSSLTSTLATLALWNPPNSGVNAVIYKAVFGAANATAAGAVVLALNTQKVIPTTPTSVAIRNCLLGSGNASKCVAYSAGTLASVPVAVSVLHSYQSGGSQGDLKHDGAYILTPGNLVSLQGIIAAGAGIGNFVWEEVPV